MRLPWSGRGGRGVGRAAPKQEKLCMSAKQAAMEDILSRHRASLDPRSARGVQCLKSERTRCLLVAAILLTAVHVGVDTELRLRSQDGSVHGVAWIVMLPAQVALGLVFWVDFCLRARSEYICSAAGAFDLCINLCDTADIICVLARASGPLAVIRALHAIRVLRLLRLPLILRCSDCCSLAMASFQTMIKSAAWASVLLAITLFAGAAFCGSALVGLGSACGPGEECLHSLFEGLLPSFLTQLDLALSADLALVREPILAASWAWALYLIAFVLLVHFGLLRGLAGIACGKLVRLRRATSFSSRRREEEKLAADEYKERLWLQFVRSHPKRSRISRGECFDMLKSEEMRPVLYEMQVALPACPSSVAMVYDEEGKGFITMQDWLSGTLRLRGSAADHQSLTLHESSLQGDRRLQSVAREVTHYIQSSMREAVREAGYTMLSAVSGLRDTICEEFEHRPSNRSQPNQLNQLEELDAFMGKVQPASADVAALCAALESRLGGLHHTCERRFPLLEPPLPLMLCGGRGRVQAGPGVADASAQTDAAEASGLLRQQEPAVPAEDLRDPSPAGPPPSGLARTLFDDSPVEETGEAASTPNSARERGDLARSALRASAGSPGAASSSGLPGSAWPIPSAASSSGRSPRPSAWESPAPASPTQAAAADAALPSRRAARRRAALVHQVQRLRETAMRMQRADPPEDLWRDRPAASGALGAQASAALHAFAAEHCSASSPTGPAGGTRGARSGSPALGSQTRAEPESYAVEHGCAQAASAASPQQRQRARAPLGSQARAAMQAFGAEHGCATAGDPRRRGGAGRLAGLSRLRRQLASTQRAGG